MTPGGRAESGHARANTGSIESPKYSVVLCTATVQHLPGYALRLRLIKDLQRLSSGYVILSFWQFLSSDRFRSKLIEPLQQLASAPADLETGDALLPWRQGVESVRYLHQVDEAELRQLAADTGQTVIHTFRADGKESDLNLYAVLGRAGESAVLTLSGYFERHATRQANADHTGRF